MKRLSCVFVFLTSSLICFAPDLKEVREVKKLHELIEKQRHETRYYRRLALAQATTGALLEYIVSEHMGDFSGNEFLVKGSIIALLVAAGLATHYCSKKEERAESNIPESIMVGGLSAVGAAGFTATLLNQAKS